MGYWRQYVPVTERKAKAAKRLKAAKKKGQTLHPIVVEGRQIAKTFWGKAWCENLENYSDYENRLPRGRTYVRNGSVIDLQISKGKVQAQVMGSYLYEITINIKAMSAEKWQSLVKSCAGKIDSLSSFFKESFPKRSCRRSSIKTVVYFPNPAKFRCNAAVPMA